MNKRLMPFVVIMVFLLMSSGCSRSNQKYAAPQDTVSEPEVTSSANKDGNPGVSIGPPIQEYYDPNQPEQKIQMVYVTTQPGLNYHRANCRYVATDKIALGLEEAKEEGYTPCSVCKPPQ